MALRPMASAAAPAQRLLADEVQRALAEARLRQRPLARVGQGWPELCETWPDTLAENPMRALTLAQNLGQPCTIFVPGARKASVRSAQTVHGLARAFLWAYTSSIKNWSKVGPTSGPTRRLAHIGGRESIGVAPAVVGLAIDRTVIITHSPCMFYTYSLRKYTGRCMNESTARMATLASTESDSNDSKITL